jgi:hypothetical protein
MRRCMPRMAGKVYTLEELEEVRKLYMLMIEIRSEADLRELLDFFRWKAEQIREELKVAKLSADVAASKQKLLMLYEGLIEECERRLRGLP